MDKPEVTKDDVEQLLEFLHYLEFVVLDKDLKKQKKKLKKKVNKLKKEVVDGEI